jgi:hypothetical protein
MNMQKNDKNGGGERATIEQRGELAGDRLPDGAKDYVVAFGGLGGNETVESMNEKFGVTGKLENPAVSQVSYIWAIKEGVSVKGALGSDGIVRSAELDCPDADLYRSNVRFADDLDSLKNKEAITYAEVKAKCGGVDGLATRWASGKVTTYVWVSEDYKLTITIGSDGNVSSFMGLPISL